jgi:hypothetical protein
VIGFGSRKQISPMPRFGKTDHTGNPQRAPYRSLTPNRNQRPRSSIRISAAFRATPRTLVRTSRWLKRFPIKWKPVDRRKRDQT